MPPPLSTTRIFLLTIFIFFHEQLIPESDRYLQQLSAYLSRNSKRYSKRFLLQRVIIIIPAQPTSINGRSRWVGLSLLHDLVNGMYSSDEANILSRLWYSRWSSGKGNDDEEAAACKAALSRRASHAGSYGEPEHDSGNVDVLMYAYSEDDEHEDTSQWKAFPVPFTTSPQSSPSPLQLPCTYCLHSSVQQCECHASFALSIESTRSWECVTDLNQLLIFEVLDAEQDVNVFVNATSGVVLTPRVPESHPNRDLSGSEQRVDSVRSRQHPLPQFLVSRDGDGPPEEDKQSENSDVGMELDGHG